MIRGRSPDAKQLIDHTHDKEAALLALTTELANLIRHPAHQWDAAAMTACWAKIDQFQSTLRKCVTQLNALERASRRTNAPTKDFAHARQTRNRLKRHLTLWTRMAQCVSQHIDAPTRPMRLERPATQSDLMLARFHTYLHKLANPNAQSQDAEDHACFADIPMPVHPFETMMQLAQRFMRARGRIRDVQFLDVGCGGGTKVLAAKQYFDHCHGLEYDATYAQAATQTLALLEPDTRVIHADALTFQGYANYDIIYFYRPIRLDPLLHQMEAHICNMVRPGTLIVAPYNTALEPHAKWTIPNLIGPIFAPGLSETAARQWADDALRSDAVSLTDQKIANNSIWAPIMEVARYRW